MIDIVYLKGDVTKPCSDGLIIHCVNDAKKMGSGVALALLKKWSRVRSEYIEWAKNPDTFTLGSIQVVWVEEKLAVVNMIGQHDIITNNPSTPPICYDAMRKCLQKVCAVAIREVPIDKDILDKGCNVHIPYKMGSDRAGGKWEIIEQLIKEELSEKDIRVYIYKFEG